MVAMLGLAVGKVDRGRVCTRVRGLAIAGHEDRGDKRLQRHTLIICQIELFVLLVDGCRICGRSRSK